MHDGAAGKMPAGPDERNVIRDAVALAGPGHDSGMRPCDPLAVIAMQMDRRAAESLTPVGDGAVEVRMRDGDRLQSAERPDLRDSFTRDHRHAIPEHAAVCLGDQQRALADGKARLDGESGQTEVFAPDELVACTQLIAREPGLPLPVDELTFVF